MGTWIQLTLDEKPGDAPAGTVIWVNLDMAGLIYPRDKGGSDIWFSQDTRKDAVKTKEAEWDGHTFVKEPPEEIMKRGGYATRS